jgi:hypothetical protein
MAWANHHAVCKVCGEHDWQRPGWPLCVDEAEAVERHHAKVRRTDGTFAYYIDAEDPHVLCDIGYKLYGNWSREVMRKVLKRDVDDEPV